MTVAARIGQDQKSKLLVWSGQRRIAVYTYTSQIYTLSQRWSGTLAHLGARGHHAGKVFKHCRLDGNLDFLLPHTCTHSVFVRSTTVAKQTQQPATWQTRAAQRVTDCPTKRTSVHGACRATDHDRLHNHFAAAQLAQRIRRQLHAVIRQRCAGAGAAVRWQATEWRQCQVRLFRCC